MIKYFALIVEDDVFHTLIMDEDHPIGAKWIAALESGVKFIKINDFSQVKPGFFYKDGNFYDRGDTEMINPISQDISEDPDKNQYAGIMENDVIGIMTTVKSEMQEGTFDMVDAGIQSDPIIVEYTNHPQKNIIRAGWIWDGSSFSKPGL